MWVSCPRGCQTPVSYAANATHVQQIGSAFEKDAETCRFSLTRLVDQHVMPGTSRLDAVPSLIAQPAESPLRLDTLVFILEYPFYFAIQA